MLRRKADVSHPLNRISLCRQASEGWGASRIYRRRVLGAMAMGIKAYQPHRKDLLINTEWGIPKKQLSKKEARLQNMRLFHGRWVTKEEKKQLKDQYHAYYSIRTFAVILILMPLWILVLFLGTEPYIKDYNTFYILSAIYVVASMISGIGLLPYRRWARFIATLVLIPLIPVLIGIIGLHYLYRKTARQIFSEPVTDL